LDRLRSRGDNNLYLLDLVSGKDTLLTRHDGIATFFGELTLDGSTAYVASNKDRDLTAFARIRMVLMALRAKLRFWPSAQTVN